VTKELERPIDQLESVPWTEEEIAEEIRHQAAERSCGADGIHIRLLKALAGTVFVGWLYRLYNRCLAEGRTPQAWNDSEIHLLSKDPDRPRDADNLRPISIIYVFHKVLERLLLVRHQSAPWARLHPA